MRARIFSIYTRKMLRKRARNAGISPWRGEEVAVPGGVRGSRGDSHPQGGEAHHQGKVDFRLPEREFHVLRHREPHRSRAAEALLAMIVKSPARR
jgi:hypothetical protein